MKTFLAIISLIFFTQPCFAETEKSTARIWNEQLLNTIRSDYARPTVAARNLYHLSIALYDSWAIFDENASNYFINFKQKSQNLEQDRATVMSYAAYRLLAQRCAKHPKREQVLQNLQKLMTQLGYDPNFDVADLSSPAGTGNLVAQMIIDRFNFDGALEAEDYATPVIQYAPLNPPMIVKLPGAGNLIDVNLWQPLALDMIIDQGGNPLPNKVTAPLTLHWGGLPPFALTERERNPINGLYLDPGPPPQFAAQDEEFRRSITQVIEFSSWLDPRDNVRIDISPSSTGNNSLGKNDGRGHRTNPFTQKPYEPNLVLRGDYARVLAEFWADGPTSETPPGHWNVLANYVTDRPEFTRKWMGQGDSLSRLEWDVKMYITLNGALYDSSIAAWGLKGYYQGSRPISAVRYMADLGQSSQPELPHYHPHGLPLVPNLIELITPELTAPGKRFAHLVGHEDEIAIRAWKGSPKNHESDFKGVGWITANTWVPYQRPTFVTPPFPGYVSGHSTFSRAGAEVMTAITGNSFFPGGLAIFTAEKNKYLVFEDGPSETIQLQWATYYDAADQCSLSRIFGGIHAYIDDFPGRRIGSVIGRKAVAKANTLFGVFSFIE
jgi:hypothetical protein